MKPSTIFAAFVAAALLSGPARAADPAPAAEEEQQPKYHPTEGPAKVALGSLAEIELPESAVCFNQKETRELLEQMGNITNGNELGLVSPKADGEDWILVYEYEDIGYIKDAAKEKIDADEILKNIREGTEQSNAERKKRGHTAMHVTGWAEPPHYDPKTQNLTWATLYETDDGHKGFNYNVRLLGRSGVMSVTLVDAPEKLAASKAAAEKIIAATGFKQGKRYAEWRNGDKVAEYGLTALVAAGAGAAAAKLGFFALLGKLFAKMGKLVVLVIAAIGGALAKFWNSLRGKFTPRKPAARSGGDAGAGGGTPPPANPGGDANPPAGTGQGGGFLE
jgi:uncharacterized membrane-anchored protein